VTTESPAAGGGGFWRADRIAAAFLFALALAVAWQCRRLPLGGLGEPGPAAWPLLLAALLALLSIAIFAAGRASPPLASLGWSERGHALAVVGAAAFAAAALETLGYRLTVLATLLFLLGAVERRRPLPALAVAVGLAFGTHLVFARWLRVPLPVGVLGL
jgi:putative tricarboxylic transport membrane protein